MQGDRAKENTVVDLLSRPLKRDDNKNHKVLEAILHLLKVPQILTMASSSNPMDLSETYPTDAEKVIQS